MLILPAIDLRGGKCVRLFQGDYALETVYSDDPAEVARRFATEGAKWLHVVDLDGAKEGAPQNFEAFKRIRASVDIPIQFGGGIRSLEIAKEALSYGATRVVLGSKVVKAPDEAKRIFGALDERAIAGLDAREGKVATEGWTQDSGADVVTLARAVTALGAFGVIVTDIGRDGTLEGPNLELLSQVCDATRAFVFASGGVSSLHDLSALKALRRPNLVGAIVGKAFYENRFSVAEAEHAANG